MHLQCSFAHARINRSVALFIAFAILGACRGEKSSPPSEQARPAATASNAIPESSGDAFSAYLASHLPPGLKQGDFLTNKRDYPTDDTADVYRTVLDTLYVTKNGSPGEVVIDDVAHTRMVTCTHMPCPLLPMHQKEVGLQTMDAYRTATLTRRHIRPFKYHLPLRLIGDDDRRALEVDGRTIISRVGPGELSPQEHPFYIGFAAKYPRSWGFATLSTVGMDSARKEALVEVTHHCGGSCYSTEVMYLWKVRDRWHVVERMPEGDPGFTGDFPTLHFRSVRGTKSEEERQADARAKARKDSIEQDKLPRDIHGKLTTREGQPIVGATISLHDGDTPNVPYMFTNTDGDGNYRFVKPMIGEPGVMVRCPHMSLRPDSLVIVSATTVAPGTLRELNIAVDRAACENAAYAEGIKTIQPPIPPFEAPPIRNNFDVQRAMRSGAPSDEEAAIYRILLDNMWSTPGAQQTLVYATTRSACTRSTCREDYMRRIRYEPRVMLSTMENFLALREHQIDLKAGLALGPSTDLVGDSALAGLERAAHRGGALDNFALLHAGWPSVGRVVSFSRIGFSPNHVQAIVEVIRTDNDGHRNQLWILDRFQIGWKIVRWLDE